jgi:site-specific DNA recombinase
LKLIPEEAEIVRTIYQLYVENDSQTLTEAELMKRGIKTKNDRYFTRFSIKSILQNPVYVVADQDAYEYFVKVKADLYSDQKEFDGTHGIMAYNRTNQKKGKATEFLPPGDWIVSVGAHQGIIPGKAWVAVQESLERNKSKAYHKPRNNEALLTGLLYCSCGSRMYPKISKRRTADGKPVYTYVCKMKERSQRSLCNEKNANGNSMDTAIVEQIKMLEDDQGSFIRQLEQSRRFYTGNRTDYEERLAGMRQEKAGLEKKMENLVDSLAELSESTAKNHVAKRIEQLNQECLALDAHISEMEGLTAKNELSDMEFAMMRQLLSVFKSSIDEMSVEQKRAAIRTLVRKVVWDGENAHVVLFGVEEGEVELPDSAKTHLGEDSK